MGRFPLLRVPLVPLRIILYMLDCSEIMTMTACSSQIEKILRLIKYKIKFVEFMIDDKKSCFRVIKGAGNYSVNFMDETEDGETFSTFSAERSLCSRFRKFDEYGYLHWWSNNPMEDCIKFADRFRLIFRPVICKWIFYPRVLTKSDLKRFTTIAVQQSALFGSLEAFEFSGGAVDLEIVSHVMDSLPLSSKLILATRIPAFFNHPNAVSFTAMKYYDAEWMTIEEILDVRNCEHLVLTRTSLECTDFNKFLRYWVDCDQDMMKQFVFHWKEGSQLDLNIIFNHLLVVENFDFELRTFNIMARNNGHRKLLLGNVQIEVDGIKFITMSSEETEYSAELLHVMEVVNRMSSLDKEREELEKQGMTFRKQLDELSEWSDEKSKVMRGFCELQNKIRKTISEYNELREEYEKHPDMVIFGE